MKKISLLFTLLFWSLISCTDADDTTLTTFPNCGSFAQVLSTVDFNSIETNNYGISSVLLNGDCLEVTLASSGCDAANWLMSLNCSTILNTMVPVERNVKIKLVNTDTCLAIFSKTVTFDLTPFRVPGQNQVILTIEGWNVPVNYVY
jgi:hypothetical protein